MANLTKSSLTAVITAAVLLAPLAIAKDKKAKHQEDAKDEIQVVTQIPVTGGPVTRFLATQHYNGLYLYAEHQSGEFTLIDLTKDNAPVLLANVASAPGGSATLSAVAGTAALVGSEPTAVPAVQQPQTMRIMDFSNPQTPRVVREFSNVTAMNKDAGRGLIFLADSQNIWILRQHLAEDPKEQQAYLDYLFYGSK